MTSHLFQKTERLGNQNHSLRFKYTENEPSIDNLESQQNIDNYNPRNVDYSPLFYIPVLIFALKS